MIVIKGEVDLSIDGIEVEKPGPGDTFGEGSFDDFDSSCAEVISDEDTALAKLGNKEFKDLLKNEPKHALKFKLYFKQLNEKPVYEVEGLSFFGQRRYFALVAHI